LSKEGNLIVHFVRIIGTKDIPQKKKQNWELGSSAIAEASKHWYAMFAIDNKMSKVQSSLRTTVK
jgi:hypothetical protein